MHLSQRDMEDAKDYVRKPVAAPSSPASYAMVKTPVEAVGYLMQAAQGPNFHYGSVGFEPTDARKAGRKLPGEEPSVFQGPGWEARWGNPGCENMSPNPRPTLRSYVERWSGRWKYGIKGFVAQFQNPDEARNFVASVSGYFPGAHYEMTAPKTDYGAFTVTFPGVRKGEDSPRTAQGRTTVVGGPLHAGERFNPANNPGHSHHDHAVDYYMRHASIKNAPNRGGHHYAGNPSSLDEVMGGRGYRSMDDWRVTLAGITPTEISLLTSLDSQGAASASKLGSPRALKKLVAKGLAKGETTRVLDKMGRAVRGKAFSITDEGAEAAMVLPTIKGEVEGEDLAETQAAAAEAAGGIPDTSFEFGAMAGQVGQKHAHTGHPLSGAVYRPVIRKQDLLDGKPFHRLPLKTQERLRAVGYKVRSPNPLAQNHGAHFLDPTFAMNPDPVSAVVAGFPYWGDVLGGVSAGVALAATGVALKKAGTMSRRRKNPSLAIVGMGFGNPPVNPCGYCGAALAPGQDVCHHCWAGQRENPALAVVGMNPSFVSATDTAKTFINTYGKVEGARIARMYASTGDQQFWNRVAVRIQEIPVDEMGRAEGSKLYKRHNPGCTGCPQCRHPNGYASNGFFAKAVNKLSRKAPKLITDKGKKRMISVAKARQIAIKDGQLANFEASLAAYREFWGVEPRRVIDHSYDDGRKGTINEFGAGLGIVPETVYAGVPKGSFKREKGKKITYVHKHAKGGEPHEVVIPRMGFTVKVGGKSTIGKWWDEKKHRRH